MRSDIARRFAGVSRRFLACRSSAGSFGFDDPLTRVRVDDVSDCTVVDGVVASDERARGVAQ